MGVPSGSDLVLQPLVSVLLPVDEQWAAWPRYTPPEASVKTKLAVHCPAPPRNEGAPVNVITPGWIVALPAGAQAEAPAAGTSAVRASTTAKSASLRHCFIE